MKHFSACILFIALTIGHIGVAAAEDKPTLSRLHQMCIATGRVGDIEDFYEDYNVPDTCAFKKKDMAIIDAYYEMKANNLTVEEFIRTAAPYYVAYRALTNAVSGHIKNREWDKAFMYASQFSPYFGNDHNFQDLLRVLNKPETQRYEPYSFGDSINTPFGSEYAMVISADEKTIYFTGVNRKDNLGGEDIYVSHLTNGTWSKAQRMDEVNSIFGNESAEGLSLDGTELIIFQDGITTSSVLTAKGWSEPMPFLSRIQLSNWQSDAMISSDGKALLFAASTKSKNELYKADDLYEATNIYVAFKDSTGHWADPIDLGPTINTPFADRSPFLHPDMRTLYFCSAGHSTLGGMDVFKSTRLREDSWTEWSEPINLGYEINTVEEECWYRISTDGAKAFFSQSQDGSHNLCWMYLPDDVKPNPVATISGKVTDLDGNPVSVYIRWEDLESHEQLGAIRSAPDDGRFFIVLPEGKNYGYFIDDEKYFPVADNIDLRGVNEPVHIEHNIQVVTIDQMIELGIPMPLNNLFFNTAEAVLLPPSITELQRVIRILNKRSVHVEIAGHTDNVGNDHSNQVLSENRAAAVKEYLIENGISAELLTTVGYGESRPRDTNETDEGRRHNRRVECKFVK